MRGCGHRECGNFVVDDLPDPVTYAVPAFVLLLIVEMIVSLRADKSRYSARDTLTSLMLGTGSQVAGAFVGAAVIGMSVWVYQRSEEHTSELQSLMRISYAVFCLKKKTTTKQIITIYTPAHTYKNKIVYVIELK